MTTVWGRDILGINKLMYYDSEEQMCDQQSKTKAVE
jgi:hypothetical protein